MVPSQLIPRHRRRSSAVAAWNSGIRHAVSDGDARHALLLFRQMKQQSHDDPATNNPDNFTFPFVAKACAKLSDLRVGRMVHAGVAKTPHCWDKYVQTALIDMYAKCSELDCAHQVFDEMLDRDIASWNAILLGFAQTGVFDRVSMMFNQMRNDGVAPDVVTVMGLTQLASSMNRGCRLLLCAVHCFGVKCGFGGDLSVANTWISGYAKCGDLCSAETVFSGIDRDALSVVSWNATIAGCACVEEPDKAIGIYRRMISHGCRPDLVTCLNLLSSFAQPKYLYYGMLVHALAVKAGCDTNVALLNTLICMYSKCGDVKSARCIFDSMNKRSCCSWTVMIGGYSEKGDLDEALSLFHEMEGAGEMPDVVTVMYLIAACGKVGALEVGKWFDTYTVSKRLKNDVTVCNALLDMYMKCGSVTDAQRLFDTMNGKNVVSWTTLIAGFALNGEFQPALDHFTRMLELGLKPNHVTFLAVLQACTHAGFLAKGWEVFDMMKMYGINPGLDHYACMTDLLGRGGKLKEALECIQGMPIKPDAGIWGALLSACKIHQNIEIGEQAGYELFRLEPQAAAPYVEMANLYALGKDWSGVAAMRMKMKNQQVAKSPGQSIICIDGQRCSFTVEDRFHSKGFEIFETLDSLALQMKNETDCIYISNF